MQLDQTVQKSTPEEEVKLKLKVNVNENTMDKDLLKAMTKTLDFIVV